MKTFFKEHPVLAVLAFFGVIIVLYSIFAKHIFKPSIAQMKEYILSKGTDQDKARLKPILEKMNDDEITSVYTLYHDYMIGDATKKPVPSDLKVKMQAISDKYNIFT